jgi:pilus assembly protein CpaB
MTRRNPGRPSRGSQGLQTRWYNRIRQGFADRRRGGRLPRTMRRLAAVTLVVAAGLIAMAPRQATGGNQLVTFAGDLPIGARIESQDLLLVNSGPAPDGAVGDPSQVVGRELAGRVRRGEVVTDVRLTDPVGPDPGPGRVAVPIRPADPAIVELLGPGMHVAVISVSEAGEATALATDAVVLAIAAAPERGSTDRSVVLAVPADAADRIVAAATTRTIALRFT